MANTMGVPDRDPDLVFYHDDGRVEAIWLPRHVRCDHHDHEGTFFIDDHLPSDHEYESTEYPFEV